MLIDVGRRHRLCPMKKPQNIPEEAEKEDPYGAFLPPPVSVDSEDTAPFMRAVVFVTENTKKGTERSGQEYQNPLLVMPGEEYSRATFVELHERICDELRSRGHFG